MAQAAGKDPIEYRLAVLDPKSTASAPCWSWCAAGRVGTRSLRQDARGVAMHTELRIGSGGGGEVSVDKGRIRVHKGDLRDRLRGGGQSAHRRAQVTSAVA